MKSRNNSFALVGLGVSFAFSQMVGCEAIDTCENRLDCSHYATGGTGAMGDGDGDGDETAGGNGGSGGHAPSTGGTAPGSGAADSSGGMGGVPFSCDTCEGDTSACDNEAEECFACTQEDATHCDPETPVCGPENSCVECTTQNPTACTDTEAPVCGPENTCVQCTEAQPDACADTETPVCSPDNTCVQCTDAEMHCPELSAPVCSEGTCTGCATHEDCSERFEDTPVCDEVTGTCRECTPESEAEACGEFSCDPATYTCTATERESLEPCEPCVSDSECEAPENHHCVPMVYDGMERGGYCLQVYPGCAQPYTIQISGRDSVSGLSGKSYCGINESLTSCDAVLALTKNRSCEDDTDCPTGGLCRTVGGIAGLRCTYECNDPVQCKSAPNPGATCGPGESPDPVAPDYCGGKD